MQNAGMSNPQQFGQNLETTSDALTHVTHIRQMLSQVVQHCREDQTRVDEPMARALFETTAEALLGLMKAYEDYEQNLPEWH
jgi:hypothetical protein